MHSQHSSSVQPVAAHVMLLAEALLDPLYGDPLLLQSNAKGLFALP